MKTHNSIHPLEWLVLAVILLAANIGLLWGDVRSDWIYFPQGRGGWTLLTHPFVHVSFYHLLLDAGAFVFLYHSLGKLRPLARWFSVLLCGLGSFSTAVLFTPDLPMRGFCGLSGIGHGLMAMVGLMTALDAEADPTERWIMAGLSAGLAAKVLLEAFTGSVFFGGVHFGNVGNPVTVCHLGGVIGGLIALAFNRSRNVAEVAMVCIRCP